MRGLKGQELANGPAARPIRLLRRTASRDFVHWSSPEVVLEGRDLDDQIYSMPVTRVHDLYLGLPPSFAVVIPRA